MQYKDVGGSIVAEGFAHPYPDVHTESWNQTPHILPKRYDAWRDEEVNKIVMDTLGVHRVALERSDIPITPRRDFGSTAPDLDSILSAAQTAPIYSTPAAVPHLSINNPSKRQHWGDVDQLLSDSKVELAAAKQRNKLGTSSAAPDGRRLSPRRLRYLMSPTTPSHDFNTPRDSRFGGAEGTFGTNGSQIPPSISPYDDNNYTDINKLALPLREQSPTAPVERTAEGPPPEIMEKVFRPPPPPSMGLLCVGQEVMIPDSGTIRAHAAWVKECSWLVTSPKIDQYSQKIAAIAGMAPTTITVRYQDGIEIDLPRSLFTRDGINKMPPRRKYPRMMEGKVPTMTETDFGGELLSNMELQKLPTATPQRTTKDDTDPRVKKQPVALKALDGFNRRELAAQRWDEFPNDLILPISDYMKSQGKNQLPDRDYDRNDSDISLPSMSEFQIQKKPAWDDSTELPVNTAKNIEHQFELKMRQLSNEEDTDRTRLTRFRNL